MAKRLCPHCGNSMFAAVMTMACIVETTEDENKPFKLVKKGNEDKAEINVVKCMHCKRDVVNNQLVSGIICKECGRAVPPESLNQDGVCEVCQAKKERKELQNATPEELIAMLLAAEKRAAAPSVNNKVAKAAEAAASVVEKAEAAAEEKPEEKAEEKKEETAKKTTRTRGKTKKKKEENGPEQVTETVVDVPEKEVEEAVSDIADSQEAPFPDTDVLVDAINPPEEQPAPEPSEEAEPAQQEEPAPFAMFDDEEEEQPF